jgi:histone-lysine N-methyltransferase SETMAR
MAFKTQKFKQTSFTLKIMATVFRDRKGILPVEFMLRHAIQNRRQGLLSSRVMLLHDNAPARCCQTHAIVPEFGWEVFEHPAYSLDLAPSDFHLFPPLKEFLGGRHFKSDEEVKDDVKEWLNGLAAEVYDEGIQNLITRYDKCLHVGGDCRKITSGL